MRRVVRRGKRQHPVESEQLDRFVGAATYRPGPTSTANAPKARPPAKPSAASSATSPAASGTSRSRPTWPQAPRHRHQLLDIRSSRGRSGSETLAERLPGAEAASTRAATSDLRTWPVTDAKRPVNGD